MLRPVCRTAEVATPPGVAKQNNQLKINRLSVPGLLDRTSLY